MLVVACTHYLFCQLIFPFKHSLNVPTKYPNNLTIFMHIVYFDLVLISLNILSNFGLHIRGLNCTSIIIVVVVVGTVVAVTVLY